MSAWIESLLILMIITDLILLGSSRVWNCIRIVAIQGGLLGLLTLAAARGHWTEHILVLAIGSVLVKSFILPWLLFRALRDADITAVVEPFVGYSTSLVIGTLTLPVALWLASRLPLPNTALSPLVVPIALYTILVGLFVIVSRKKALTQVLGYLVLENGIYAFGVALVIEVPLSVELGILLDLVVAVFLMGIAIFHINRSFDHIDTNRLSTLKDWLP